MSRQSEYTRRLCRLIHSSVSPFKISELSVPITINTDKQILIALSQVARQIKQWTDVIVESDTTDEKANRGGEYSLCLASEDHQCLTKIVTLLVSLLAVRNKYVQHIAGNILVVIYKFLAASGSGYNEYIQLLGLCLEISTCDCLRTMEPQTRYDESSSELITSFVALKKSLKSTNWSTVAGVISILHNILKHIKKECDDQLLEVYLSSIRICLLNIPWNVFDEVCLGRMHLEFEDASPLMLYNGNLVQFFCSLAAHGYASETSAACVDEQPVARIINDAFPKVLAWCLSKQEDCNRTSTSHYLRHKILKLMVRLTYQIRFDCRVLVSWLNIIRIYFQDLLSKPLSTVDSHQDDCLEGSPFLVSFAKDNKGISYRHLQRLAVFLFLRCSMSLVCQREGSNEHCVCATMNPSLLPKQNLATACCNRKQGSSGLYQWLREHFTGDIFLDNDIYIQRCTSFSSTFLQLYMHEDDILFKVLLQLFCIPLAVQPVYNKSKTSQKVEHEDNMFRLLSDLLNPIRLFHLFIAELHYDHQVLLDYLISQDTGPRSAEYLLRCLRAVCDSWTSFVEFSLDEKVSDSTNSKKRKVGVDVLDFEEGESANCEAPGIPFLLAKRCMTKNVYSSEEHRTTKLPFENVMECLLSLKTSLVNLHQKKLFPYNPDALLRRLTRFEGLCYKERNIPISESGNTM